MNEKSSANNSKSPLAAVLRFTLIWIFCYFSVKIISSYLLVYFLNIDANNLNRIYDYINKENMWSLKSVQALSTVGCFMLPPLIYIYSIKKRISSFTGISKPIDLKLLLSTIIIVLLSGPIVYWLLVINQGLELPQFLSSLERAIQSMEDEASDIIMLMIKMESIDQLFINLFIMAILPGVGEELLFRGVLQKLLGKFYKNPHLGIIGAAMIFSFIHFQFYGFLPRMALGVLFGYLYFWSGNLLYPIIGHILHNGAQVLMVYSLGSDFSEQELESVGQYSPYVIMITTVFLLITLASFQRKSKNS